MIFAANGPPFAALGVKAGEKCPCIPCPSRIGEGVMASTHLVRQFRITQFDGQLLDVQAELREVKGQFVHVAEQPG